MSYTHPAISKCRLIKFLMSPFLAYSLRWGVILGVPFSITVGNVQPSMALPVEEIADKLAGIPVYVIRNDDGLVTISRPEAEATRQAIIYAFMSRQDAATFLTRANTANPNFSPGAEIGLIDLNFLYQGIQSNSSQLLQIVYVPTEDRVAQAISIDSNYEGGVP